MTTNREEGTERNDEYIVKQVQREMMNINSEEGRQKGTLSKHKKVLKKTCNLLGQNTTRNFGAIPFIATKQHLKQINGEKRCKMRWRAKPLICFWLSYVEHQQSFLLKIYFFIKVSLNSSRTGKF